MGQRLFGQTASFILGQGQEERLYLGPRVEAQRMVEGIAFSFEVARTSKAEPDTLDLKVSNLAPETRKRIAKGMRVVLNAGYVDTQASIFVGTVRHFSSKRDGTRWLTHLKCGDGDFAYDEARVSVSLSKGATLPEAVAKVAESMGVDATEALRRVGAPDVPVPARTYASGFAASGKSSQVLSRALARAGLRWTTQGGKLVVLGPSEVQPGMAVLLTEDTGLRESPELNDSKKDKGPPTTSMVSSLQPGIYPGTCLDVRAENVKGLFRAVSVKHVGDTHGNDWTTQIEATQL